MHSITYLYFSVCDHGHISKPSNLQRARARAKQNRDRERERERGSKRAKENVRVQEGAREKGREIKESERERESARD